MYDISWGLYDDIMSKAHPECCCITPPGPLFPSQNPNEKYNDDIAYLSGTIAALQEILKELKK